MDYLPRLASDVFAAVAKVLFDNVCSCPIVFEARQVWVYITSLVSVVSWCANYPPGNTYNSEQIPKIDYVLFPVV
jgi:hypothetical protein